MVSTVLDVDGLLSNVASLSSMSNNAFLFLFFGLHVMTFLSFFIAMCCILYSNVYICSHATKHLLIIFHSL